MHHINTDYVIIALLLKVFVKMCINYEITYINYEITYMSFD